MRGNVKVFFAIALLSGPALAENTGFELMARPAYGSAGGKSPVVYQPTSTAMLVPGQAGDIFSGTAAPYGGGFIGDVYAGYRFLPILSAGLTAGLRSSSASAPSDGTTDLTRSAWRAGFYARAYLPLIPSLDPWVSIGIGYMGDSQTYQRPLGGVNATYKLTHNGIEVPLGVGVDYNLLPLLAVGPSFEYAVVSGAGGCFKPSAPGFVSNSFCTDADASKKIIAAKSYGVWSLGLDVRLTL
jgi:hypothetical protein